MKRALLLGVICSIGIFTSCMKEESQNEFLSIERESKQVFIKRNAILVEEIHDFILENQALILSNQEQISSKFKGNLLGYFSSIKSDDMVFNRLVNRAKYNVG